MKLSELTQEKLDDLLKKLDQKDLQIAKKNTKIRHLRKLSAIDDLTGLNRMRLLPKAIKKQFSLAKRSGMLVVFLFMDIDRFKRINEVFSHIEANEILKKISLALKKSLRETDELFRFGGDEFLAIILIPREKGAEELSRIMIRIHKKLLKINLPPNSEIKFVTMTMGRSYRSANQTDYKKAIKEASQAMLRFKEKRKQIGG